METLTLTELAGRCVRRWRVLAAGTLIGLTVGVTAHVAQPDRFRATAVVFVDGGEPDRIDMVAEAAVASSRRVSDEALDALGDPDLTIRELEEAASAEAVSESRLLRIGFTADRARDAARGADAVAQAYLAVRSMTSVAPRPGAGTAADGEQPAGFEGVVVDAARVPAGPSGPGLAATALGTTVLGLVVASPLAARPTPRLPSSTRTRGARAS